MPDKKPNVLNQFFCAFRLKKSSCEDIVSMADKVVGDYIYSKNRLIHRKCRKNNGAGILIFSLITFAFSGLALLFLHIT